MFALTVSFRIAPGQMSRFLPLMRENATSSLKSEPGCHQFDICTDPGRPDEVFLYEIYTDEAAFKAHLETPHFKQFDSAATQMIAEKTIHSFREVIR